MAGVSENENGWTASSECGDRGLAIYYVSHNKVTKPTYRFSTYNEDSYGTCEPYNYGGIGLPFDSFEGKWYYIYYGYSRNINEAHAFI